MKQIEWLNTQLRPRAYRAALFDFDGTISLIREGWQPIMYGYFTEVLSDVSPDEPKEQIEVLVRDFVDRLTGKQTIYQCIYLAEEIQRRGGRAEAPIVYKQEYNKRLLEHIEHRVDALKSGAADRDEFLIPGSIELLESLRERGLVLYLASGTDHEYVVDEAAALGITSYFNGGIYGALDDYENFSKEQVIRDLVLPEIAAGDALLGFGDGYVEIENVKAVGGVAVGVASNEKEREGIDQWKRERLIQAGADVIIGDFRCQELLLENLFGGKEDGVSSF
ncbi:MAG: HAD hydrolase-like protein [Bacillota bacterium]|nr:HAD hydrolase-like protein [Bacillota bacterium]HKM16607.1 HAD family hydrolase [Limnochordia bacterium]